MIVLLIVAHELGISSKSAYQRKFEKTQADQSEVVYANFKIRIKLFRQSVNSIPVAGDAANY